jgi:hypothetical protein
MKLSNLTPAVFFGSPVAFIASGLLVNVMPGAAALAVGAVVGTLCGRALLMTLSKPASQRS